MEGLSSLITRSVELSNGMYLRRLKPSDGDREVRFTLGPIKTQGGSYSLYFLQAQLEELATAIAEVQ